MFIHPGGNSNDTIRQCGSIWTVMVLNHTWNLSDHSTRAVDLGACTCSHHTPCFWYRKIHKRFKFGQVRTFFLRLVLLVSILVSTRWTLIYLACTFYKSLRTSGNNLIASYFIICSCGPDWSAIDAADSFYNWYIMTMGFAIPTLIVGFCNMSVVYVSHKVWLLNFAESFTTFYCYIQFYRLSMHTVKFNYQGQY